MNLTTRYLGLQLANPIVVGASPFCDNLAVARQLQDAGAAALVMHSLFEEQIEAEQRALVHHVETPAESTAEATSYFPDYGEYQLSPDNYARQLGLLKAELTIPVIASLNGSRPGGWTDHARRLESAGADALELNLYQLATDRAVDGEEIEERMRETVEAVVHSVRIPVAVKLSPFHAAPANFVAQLEAASAAGVVLFNRFHQPDFNLEELEVQPALKLSDSSELLLRLRWLAIISPHARCSLAASGGIHATGDVIKALLAGAHCTQVVSVVLRHGPRVISSLLGGLRQWMEERGYEDVGQMRGALNLSRCPDPAAHERANYIRILQSWRV
ncbi:MAG: dihydroorotate dehydrogenase-like protein [Opitutaceae bacterium]